MEKRKQWRKPELGVLARSKPEETTGPLKSGGAKYYLGPAPAPAYVGPVKSGGAQYYLGPAPAPSPYYVGPAVET